MKRLYWLLLLCALPAWSDQRIQGDCTTGNVTVVTAGISSTTKVMASYPSCTVTVNVTGGGIATIYGDNSRTPLSNPFTANGSGHWFFYVPPGTHVDVQLSGGGLGSPVTLGDILSNDVSALSGDVSVTGLGVVTVTAVRGKSLDATIGTTTTPGAQPTISPDGTKYIAQAKPVIDIRDYSSCAAAIAAATANSTVLIPAGQTCSLDTASPVSIAVNGLTIMGEGCGSIISVAGTGNLFNISAQSDTFRDFCVTISATSSRLGSALFNLQAGALMTKMQNVQFTGNGTSPNNGRIINADVSVAGVGEFLGEHLRVSGGGTWTSALFTRTSSGTVAGFTLNDLISFSGVTYSDALMIADTGTDTWKLAQIENGSTGVALNTRDSLTTLPPRWIHCTDCRLEAGGFGTANPVVKIDTVRDFSYMGGYVASGQNGFVINGGNQIKVIGTEIVNIGQHSVTITATAAGTQFVGNTFEDCGISANNSYDCVNISNNVADFTFAGNSFRRINANQPRYAFNLSGTGVGFYILAANDTTQVAWGTAALNRLSSSLVQRIVGNAGIPDFIEDSAGVPVFFNGMTIGSSGPCISGASTGSVCVVTPATAGSNTATLPANTGTVAELNLAQNFSAMQYFTGNTFFVTSDFTTANNTNLQAITGLSWTMPASLALNMPFSCEILYSQATAAVADQFGIQDVTVAPTNISAKANVATSASAATYGNLPTLTTTTATAFVTFTPSNFATVFNAKLSGFIEQPSNASSSVVQIMVQTSAGADAMTIKRDSWCRVF